MTGEHAAISDRRLAGGWVPWIVHGWVLAGATAAVFLASGPAQGSLGIFLVCAGIALTACPPQVRVDGRLWAAAGGLAGAGALAFLPVRWSGAPGWRRALEASIHLPASVSVVPWETAFWLAVLALSLLSGLFLLAQPLRSRGLRTLATGGAVVCAVYAALAIYAKQAGWHYPFDGGATFGFFPNRNHTATLLMTGSLLAMGVLGVVLREGRWLIATLAGAALTICVVALGFFSSSRGGVVFLGVGTVLWVGGLGRAHRHTPLLVSVGALVVAAGVLFLVSGSEVRNRLLATVVQRMPAKAKTASPLEPVDRGAAGKPAAEGPDTPFDFRVLIYRDTLRLIRDFPVTGTGLGTFAPAFSQYRDVSLSESRSIHPESDWLMLAAEAGLPALLCALALLGLLALRLPPLREHPYWPLRWGCVVAAAAAALHGLVDVPAHHVALGWWILVIGGLGFQPGRAAEAGRSGWQHAAFVTGGLAMLVLGGALIRAEWFGGAPLPPFGTARDQSEIVRAYEHHDIEGAVRIARRAISAAPMEETLYYELGALELPFADSDAEVDAAFQAERLLDPSGPDVPLRQGEAWLHYDSARTSALWLDALSRRQRLDRLTGRGAESGVGFYRDLVGRATEWPAVQEGLLAAANDRPIFALAWLESARPELVEAKLEELSAQAAFLQQLDPGQKRRLLLVWYTAGDRGKLTRFIDSHADWQEAAWPVRVRQWVDTRQFERAVQAAAARYRISLALPIASREGDSGGPPAQEEADPVAAFSAYWRHGNTIAARRLLAEANGSGARPIPIEMWRLKAAEAAQRSDWAAAWPNLRQYIRAVHGDEPW